MGTSTRIAGAGWPSFFLVGACLVDLYLLTMPMMCHCIWLILEGAFGLKLIGG